MTALKLECALITFLEAVVNNIAMNFVKIFQNYAKVDRLAYFIRSCIVISWLLSSYLLQLMNIYPDINIFSQCWDQLKVRIFDD
jgi:hypothetical protein